MRKLSLPEKKKLQIIKFINFNIDIKEEFMFFYKTYDKEFLAVEFNSENAHNSDKKGEEGASISRCPENNGLNYFHKINFYIDFESRLSSRFGVMQARIPGRTAKMIWMTQIQKTAPMSP